MRFGILSFLILVGIILIYTSCSTPTSAIFSKKSLHERYGQKLEAAGLKETALGRQWFTAAKQALNKPVTITLPYREAGYFPADQPRAVGLLFTAKRGEKLLFQLEKQSLTPFALYTELWQTEKDSDPDLLFSLDTIKNTFDFEINETGAYLLRLQPELLSTGSYTLSISIGPSLAFPVAGTNGKISSIWGDDRDAGARQHEGIDIFAPRRTPVVAAADGVVTRVNENNLGGKVVWYRPHDKNYNLYYAHLDEQLTQDGRRHKKGDTLGLVGNTGNARTTPPHLHFGIYTFGGAIDPLPFINPAIKKPKALEDGKLAAQRVLRLANDLQLKEHGVTKSYKSNTLVYALANSTNGYRVAFPDEQIAVVPNRWVESTSTAVQKATVKDTVTLLEQPFIGVPQKKKIKPSSAITVLGTFNEFYFVRTGSDEEGWIATKELN